tara:strand:+ start:50 stop:556 length:507 start_codon:yes stop_codon:yes gene_type:complete
MGKNLQRVSDMLDGTYKRKIQVGYSKTNEKREIGDRWFDSDGKEWEQKDGYIASVNKTPSVGIFSKVCKDCGTNCSTNNDVKIHNEVWKKFERCYYCQIDFESKLKAYPIKWWAWTRLQDMQRWIAGRKELEQWIDEQEKIKNKKVYDMSVANAMANENVDFQIKKNT